jgi:hypothetical protein
VEQIERRYSEVTTIKAARQQGNKATRQQGTKAPKDYSLFVILPSLRARDTVADEISLASCLITQKSRRIFPKQATRAPPSLTLLYLKDHDFA